MRQESPAERFGISREAIEEALREREYDRTNGATNLYEMVRSAAGDPPSYYYNDRGIGVA